MESTAPKKSKRKPLSLLILIAMLIIAPLGSWVYLKLGINYRKGYIEELKPKTLDPSISNKIMPILGDKGKITLVQINEVNTSSAQAVLEKLDERIVDKTYLDILSLSRKPSSSSVDNDKSALSYYPEVGAIDYPSSFLLFDTSNVFRAEYKMSDQVDKELIRHLAVIIPIPEQKNDVQLKRDVEK